MTCNCCLCGTANPLLKRSKNDSVIFRSMKLQKFRHCCIELCSSFRSPALLTQGQPSALKRSKSVFLLVGHGPSCVKIFCSGVGTIGRDLRSPHEIFATILTLVVDSVTV
jgi:hypothetical protein